MHIVLTKLFRDWPADPQLLNGTVEFLSVEDPISAKVTDGDNVYTASLHKTDDGNLEVECECGVDSGICPHLGQTFAALAAAKAATANGPLVQEAEASAKAEAADKAETPAPAQAEASAQAEAEAPAASKAPAGVFQVATKEDAFAKICLYGPSGGGKTFSALQIATGIVKREGGNIAVIDTENGSAAKYADRFRFYHANLEDASPENMIDMLSAAEEQEMRVVIIDSATHEWSALKDFVTKVSKSPRHRNNTWSAWSEGGPKQTAFIRAILAYPGHVICTIRAKTEWEVQEKNGRKTPVRIGLAPDQGKGIEYEFDMLMLISPDHVAVVEKDRTGKFQDETIEKPDEDFGREISKWLRP